MSNTTIADRLIAKCNSWDDFSRAMGTLTDKKQKGDVLYTHASNNKLLKATNYKNHISIDIGLRRYIEWFLKYDK